MITFHNAFDLIANRYGLIIVARMTDIEADPHGGITPDSYLNAIAMIEKHHLRAIYIEPEFAADEISAIQAKTGVEVLKLDPLGGPRIRGYRTYQEMMRSNLNTLVNGQGMTGSLTHLPLPSTVDGMPLRHGSDSQFGSALGTDPNGMPLERRSYSDPSLGVPATSPYYPGRAPLGSQFPNATMPSQTFPNQAIPGQFSPGSTPRDPTQPARNPYGP